MPSPRGSRNPLKRHYLLGDEPALDELIPDELLAISAVEFGGANILELLDFFGKIQ
jgi:hypothetical protein